MSPDLRPGLQPNDVLDLTHRFAASPEQVFEIWSDKRHVLNWWGPKGCRLTHCEMDFRVGGAWRFCMHSDSANADHWIRGVYREIQPNHLIRFTYINESDGHEMVVTLRFERDGRSTVLHFRQEHFTSLGERDGHGRGWNSTFDLLGKYLRTVVGIGEPNAGRVSGVEADQEAARERHDAARAIANEAGVATTESETGKNCM